MITPLNPKGSRHKNSRGFTLVELAIVLAVTGVLFVGLYRLLSGGNAQLKDAAVASQQTQLLNAVKGYLATQEGGTWMGQFTLNSGNGVNISMPLPTLANAPNGTSNTNCHNGYTGQNASLKTFCDALPSGFSQATLNAYGQSFGIQVQVPPVTTSGTPPATYSFMIVSLGGDIIPDSDGGRISGEIGADGGFLYATNICGLPASTACGAYGAWTATTTGGAPGFGFAATASGHVVSRTYYSPELGSTLPWLARLPFGSDQGATNPSPTYSTMTWDMFMGRHNLYLADNNIITASQTGSTFGNIYLQNGKITDLHNVLGGTINLTAQTYLSGNAGANRFLSLISNCTVDAATQAANTNLHYSPGDAVTNSTNDCQSAIYVAGDQNVTGMLQATTLFSGTFIYQASDARLKTDIKPIPHALDSLMQMKPVSFSLKAGGHNSLGFIAQDVEQIYPQLVLQGSKDGMKAVNYDGMIAPLVAAVQELKQQNDTLRQQLQEQNIRQQKFEEKIEGKKL